MRADLPNHMMEHPFPVENNALVVGGIPLVRLAERVGQTPFYAYDRQRITDRVNHLRRNLPDEVRLHFAVKANPMPAVVQHMASLVDGFDVASQGEMRLALDTPVSADNISMAGPGKRDQELRSAIAAGVVINMESANEMERIAVLSSRLGIRAKVAVRVNPDFELKTSGMKMGGGPKPFGIDAEAVPEVFARLKQLDLEFIGFHIFSGSQNLRAEAIMEAQQKTFELAIRLAEHAPPIAKLNIGGGLGIPYFPGDKPLDLELIGRHLERLLPDLKQKLPRVEVIMELGRYLVGEAGVYVSRVVDRKISRGQLFLVVDGGMHHHLAASGNFGQVLRKNYPVLVGNRVLAPSIGLASVVGPSCTPLDILADKMELGHAEVGDLLVVLQSGAYGLSVSPEAFLSHPKALEVLV